MKREAFNHPKIRKLARKLGIPRWGARGIVESLWHVTMTQAPAGDIGRMDDADIAEDIDYHDDPSALIEALLEAGFLDRCARHRLVVHDWEEHADGGTRAKLRRRGQDFARPEPPSQPENGDALEQRAHADQTALKHHQSADYTQSQQRAHADQTPFRVCETGPDIDTDTDTDTDTGAQGKSARAGYPEAFERWWAAYPRKVGKRAAMRAWRNAKGRPPPGELIAAVERQKQSRQWRDGYVPNPATWLNQGRWDDQLKSDDRGDAPAGDSDSGLTWGGPTTVEDANELLGGSHAD